MKDSSLQNRSIYHDLLRILSTLAVICIHVCAESFTWESKMFSAPLWNYLNIFNSLSRFAVPVFIMLSGSFILEKFNEKDIKKLYTKNIFRLICAFCFWNCVYTFCYLLFRILKSHQPIDIRFIVYQFIEGPYHLWFIPMLVFLYMITPLVQKICENVKYERYFLLLASLPIIIKIVQEYIGIGPFNYLFKKAGMEFVSGYTIYYVLGHYLTKQDVARKYRITIYLMAIVSLTGTIILAKKDYASTPDKEPYIYEYLTPTVLIISVAVFLLFKYVFSKIKFKEKTSKVIVKLSSLTFGVYLSHIIFIKLLLLSPLTVEAVHPLISVPLLTVIIFILGAIVTWVISKIPVLKKYII